MRAEKKSERFASRAGKERKKKEIIIYIYIYIYVYMFVLPEWNQIGRMGQHHITLGKVI